MSDELAKRIEQVRERVRRNLPRHGDPERFHIELSEITFELTLIARAVSPVRARAEALRRQGLR